MKLWEFMIKHYGFRTEKQCEEYCGMMLVTVNGVASENHELLLFHQDYVSVIKQVMPNDGYDSNRERERIKDILASSDDSDKMPELDITPERLEEDRLKHDLHQIVFDQDYGRYVCLHCGVDVSIATQPHLLIEKQPKPGPTEELTENPQEAAKVWPKTLWHGHLVIDSIYKLVSVHIEPLLTAKGWTFQEVYLAYLNPFSCGDDDNGFIVGFDVWSDNEGEPEFFGAYVQFDVEEERGEWSMELYISNLDRLEIEGTNSNAFYNSKNGAYKYLHENWGGLVELRLD